MRLRVADVDAVASFYERVLGLAELGRENGLVRLGAGETVLVELVAAPGAPARPPHTSGLFHLALLAPDRQALARALRRLAETRWPLAGASDHLVSEALYLGDPEGNGIEIYRDRPRAQWPRDGGSLRMATLPLDLEALLDEADEGGPLAGATRVGHVHLNVADIDAAERFYHGLLGFDVTVRGYPGALFLSAGGYHHHIGVNTWAGRGAPPAPPGSRGLESYAIELPSVAALEPIAERLRAADTAVAQEDGALRVVDPAGNAVRLHARAD